MSSELKKFSKQISKKRLEALSRIDRVHIAALIWGPNPTTPSLVAKTRVDLRDALRSQGHLADFSEDICDIKSRRSIFAQQVAQAEAYDIVFSIPDSFGSIAEIHDFARIPDLSGKIYSFVDNAHANGYSAQSLIAAQTNLSGRIILYNGDELPDCIINSALDCVYRLQEFLYVSGVRR